MANPSNNDALFVAATKTVIYTLLWLALLVGIFRGAVFPLWGAESDFALPGAVIVAAIGIAVLAIVARWMVRNVVSEPQHKETPSDD